jgi:hypothetical protein
MELTRREFNRWLAGTAVLMVAGGWAWLRSLSAHRAVEALRGKTYPGPIRPLDEASVRRMGKWMG